MKSVMFVALLILLSFSVSAVCTLTPVLVNQDPIEAVPGERVKIVFQLQGVENPECDKVTFELLPSFPFVIEPSVSQKVTIESGTYINDYSSFLMVPYKLLVDESAIDGEYQINTKITSSNSALFQINKFNISVTDVNTDFIVTIDSYSFSTKKLTLGLVNIGDADAGAVTLEIPSQELVGIIGGNTKIVGDIDSTEDTTVTFDAELKDGEIQIEISYNDENGIRKFLSKRVSFSSEPFASTITQDKKLSPLFISSIVVVGILAIYLIFFRRKKRKVQM